MTQRSKAFGIIIAISLLILAGVLTGLLQRWADKKHSKPVGQTQTVVEPYVRLTKDGEIAFTVPLGSDIQTELTRITDDQEQAKISIKSLATASPKRQQIPQIATVEPSSEVIVPRRTGGIVSVEPNATPLSDINFLRQSRGLRRVFFYPQSIRGYEVPKGAIALEEPMGTEPIIQCSQTFHLQCVIPRGDVQLRIMQCLKTVECDKCLSRETKIGELDCSEMKRKVT